MNSTKRGKIDLINVISYRVFHLKRKDEERWQRFQRITSVQSKLVDSVGHTTNGNLLPKSCLPAVLVETLVGLVLQFLLAELQRLFQKWANSLSNHLLSIMSLFVPDCVYLDLSLPQAVPLRLFFCLSVQTLKFTVIFTTIETIQLERGGIKPFCSASNCLAARPS